MAIIKDLFQSIHDHWETSQVLQGLVPNGLVVGEATQEKDPAVPVVVVNQVEGGSVQYQAGARKYIETYLFDFMGDALSLDTVDSVVGEIMELFDFSTIIFESRPAIEFRRQGVPVVTQDTDDRTWSFRVSYSLMINRTRRQR